MLGSPRFERFVVENGLAVWELTVRGEKIPGQWVIVDGEFRQAERTPAHASPYE
jgi:hypothetical protein